MDEVSKSGVLIDVCPRCRGVWLDRGELNRLLEGAREYSRKYEEYYEDHRYKHDYDRHKHDYDYKRHKKRGLFEYLGDIFD